MHLRTYNESVKIGENKKIQFSGNKQWHNLFFKIICTFMPIQRNLEFFWLDFF